MAERDLHSSLALSGRSSCTIKRKAVAEERLYCGSWVCASRKTRHGSGRRVQRRMWIVDWDETRVLFYVDDTGSVDGPGCEMNALLLSNETKRALESYKV